MTREEAYKVSAEIHGRTGKLYSERLIDSLEALGILKLDSQEDIAKKDLLAHLSSSYSLCLSRDIIDFMTKGGFKVARE